MLLTRLQLPSCVGRHRARAGHEVEPFLLQFDSAGDVVGAWTELFLFSEDAVREWADAHPEVAVPPAVASPLLKNAVLTDVYEVDDGTWIVAGYAKQSQGDQCHDFVALMDVAPAENGTNPFLLTLRSSITRASTVDCGVTSVAVSPNKYGPRRESLVTTASLANAGTNGKILAKSRACRQTLVMSTVDAADETSTTLVVIAYPLDHFEHCTSADLTG